MKRLMNLIMLMVGSLLQGMAQAIPVLRTPPVIKTIIHEWTKRAHSKMIGGVCTAGLAVFALLLGVFMANMLGVMAGALLAFPAVATTRDLNTILTEMKKIQDDHKGKAMPEDVAQKFEELAAEGKTLQDEADRQKRVQDLEDFSKKVPNPTLPDDDTDQKKEPNILAGRTRIAGYMKLGDYVVAQEAYRNYVDNGMPKAQVVIARVKDVNQPVVGLTDAEIKRIFEGSLETKGRNTKAVPTLDDIIEPTRLPEIVRVTEHDSLVLHVGE
jgi:hypothetical protein